MGCFEGWPVEHPVATHSCLDYLVFKIVEEFGAASCEIIDLNEKLFALLVLRPCLLDLLLTLQDRIGSFGCLFLGEPFKLILDISVVEVPERILVGVGRIRRRSFLGLIGITGIFGWQADFFQPFQNGFHLAIFVAQLAGEFTNPVAWLALFLVLGFVVLIGVVTFLFAGFCFASLIFWLCSRFFGDFFLRSLGLRLGSLFNRFGTRLYADLDFTRIDEIVEFRRAFASRINHLPVLHFPGFLALPCVPRSPGLRWQGYCAGPEHS